jgi:hypothetical protein
MLVVLIQAFELIRIHIEAFTECESGSRRTIMLKICSFEILNKTTAG